MQSVTEKAKHIRLLILDVDGVLTNGIIYYGSQGMLEHKGFHIHDGLGIKLLKKCGIDVGIITAKKSETILQRAKDLTIQHVYAGYEEKLPAYDDIKQKTQLQDHQIAYMGDDLPDLPILKRVGLAFTVPNAADILRQQVDYVTTRKGGKGAVREVCELILEAQNLHQTALQPYLV
jgi:3-deoxy-D-manno-octulosonate 8-phosphate phosphatase (KDO 8-P phosphatase)